MTPKQQERLTNKIKKIKAALAADKRRWGGYYDDSRGLRYLPPKLYIQLGDYSGGLRYFNWFNKNFPDDVGFPDFLFEWTILLYKTGRIKEAEKKAFVTFTRNTYLFDKFFGRQIRSIDNWEGSNMEVADFATFDFEYSDKQGNLVDFATWLEKLVQTERFSLFSSKYIEIRTLLKHENDRESRHNLISKANQLENEF